MEWQVGDTRIVLAIQDWFRLDGGIMWSGIPKATWQKWQFETSTPVNENRALHSINCFLIITPKGRRILVDTSFGTPERWKRETAKMFDMKNGFNLFEQGKLEQPHVVVPTHLHWDHAGGCMKQISKNMRIPAFPEACYVFHQDEIKHALAAHPKDRSSYIRENVGDLAILAHMEMTRKVRGKQIPLEDGVTLIKTRGHTPGHMSVKIESRGHVAFISGGLIPNRWHIDVIAAGVGNDTHGLEAANHKLQLLRQASTQQWLMLLEHDPAVAGFVRYTEQGKYQFVPYEKPMEV